MSTPQPDIYIPPDPCVIFVDAGAFQETYNSTDLPARKDSVIALPDGRIIVLLKVGPTP